MRALSRVLLVGFAGVMVAGPVSGQRADDQIEPRSTELQRQAETLMGSGKLEDAAYLLETALAVDPRNRWAFVDLAKIAQRQNLYGKAIRMTKKALELDPNFAEAVAVQGQAMVELGATARAQQNLQKLQTICRNGCPQIAVLTNAINRGPTVASVKTQPAAPKSN